MKFNKLFLTLIFSLLSLYSFCQDEIKKWSKTNFITWTDFKCEPDSNSPYSAFSYYGITYKYRYTISEGKLNFNFDVYAYFNPEKSWSKPSKQSNELLKHEQLHFDIAELYSRILLEKFNSQSYSKNNYQEEIKTLFTYYYEQMKNFQLVYDEETKHMLITEKQKFWENNIKAELAKTEISTVSQ